MTTTDELMRLADEYALGSAYGTPGLFNNRRKLRIAIEQVQQDAELLDWLANNPSAALGIFGKAKGHDFAKWARLDIRAAMEASK